MSKHLLYKLSRDSHSWLYVQSCCGWIETEEEVFWHACGEVSCRLMVFPEGGKHLLEKNVAMLFVLLLFSVNNRKKVNRSRIFMFSF